MEVMRAFQDANEEYQREQKRIQEEANAEQELELSKSSCKIV